MVREARGEGGGEGVQREILRRAERLVELPEEELQRQLRRQREEEPELARQVEALLGADRGAGRFLEIPALASLPSEVAGEEGGPGEESSLPVLGRYRLLRLIGEGGMGRVFLAVRADDEYRQRVAVKVAYGPLDEEMRRRTLRERQILADLTHPGIARLLDGGTTREGSPFLVMEYIEGQPLLDYCRDRSLGLEERLDLFLAVCEAVKYAHGRLVIHRDLKPANILVGEDGQPKLLDFGIAKLQRLDAEAPGRESPTLTRPGSRPMTPDYASPEQLRGEALTTASDVYALGLLLYELLAGGPPYESSSSEGPPGDAASLERLHRSPRSLGLGRDLDAVVAKALRFEPGHRYASVDGLTADLDRFRRGLPVGARPDSLAYRLRLFVKRNRLAVGLAAAAVLVVLAFGVERGFQARTLRLERDRAEAERSKAQELADFLAGLLDSADPWHGPDRGATVVELLEAGEERLRQGAVRPPLARASILEQLGLAYRRLFLLERARPLIEEALNLRREHLGPAAPEVAASLTSLAVVETHAGRYEEAEDLHRRALEIRRGIPGEARALAESWLYLGHVATIRGRFQEARDASQRGLDLRLETLEEGHPELAEARGFLATALHELGETVSAAPLMAEAVTAFRAAIEEPRRWGLDRDRLTYQLTSTLVYQGRMLRARGDLSAAEASFREALDLRRPYYRGPHPQIAQCQSDLAAILADRGQLVEAEELYREVLAVAVQFLGEDHLDYAKTLVRLAMVVQQRGEGEEAAGLYRKGLETARRSAPDHPSLVRPLLAYARLQKERGERASAIELAEEALAVSRAAFGEEHPSVTKARDLLESWSPPPASTSHSLPAS